MGTPLVVPFRMGRRSQIEWDSEVAVLRRMLG